MSPRIVFTIAAIVLGLVGLALLDHRGTLREELAAVDSSRSVVATATDDARLTAEVDHIRLDLERARALSAREADPHLALVLGDALLTLERGDIVLRSATVTANVPRGLFAVVRVNASEIKLTGGILLVPAGTDSVPPRSGTVRVPRADFDAIRPNVRPGITAFFF